MIRYKFFANGFCFAKKFLPLHSHSASIGFVPMPRTLKRVKVTPYRFVR